MRDELKIRFRAFADRFSKDEEVLDTGLQGRDVHAIASMLENVVAIREISLDQLNEEFMQGKLG
jgi:hypothetical protein